MRVLRQVDGDGVVTAEGDSWVRRRRRLRSAFAPDRMEPFARIVVQRARAMLRKWPSHGEVDLVSAMSHLMFDVLTQALLGVRLAMPKVEVACRAIADLSEVMGGEMGRPFRLPDWLPLPANLRKRQAVRFLHEVSHDIICERRARGLGTGDALGELLWGGDRLAARGGLSDEEIRDEVLSLLHAGHETTAAALAWTCYLLATHPEEQARLKAEVDRLVQGRPAGLETINSLGFTRMIVQEALRLYVPTWILFPRQAVEDVEILGQRLRRGNWVLIFPYAVHRDPRWFPEPERFDPGRFAPGRVEHIPPYSYIPFGAGPHQCLGRQFAMAAMTLTVATVFQQYGLRPVPGPAEATSEPFLALRPKGALRVRVIRPPC
jgi:cytochrome P450